MSALEEPANLADMVRARAKARGDAIAFEFEGRQTTFAEFDIKTNRVANALNALGVKPRERIAYLGKNSDIYFELLMGAMKANVVMAPVNWRLAGPEIAFIVEDCKAPVLFVGPEFITQVRNIQPQLPDRAHRHHDRRRRAGMAGFYGMARRAERRRPQGRDRPQGHRDPALYLGHHGQAEGRDAVACQFSQSGGGRRRPEARLEQMDRRRRLAGGDAGVPHRRLRLGRDGPLPRRQGRDRARIRSDQGAGFLRAVRHHKTVHGAGRDAVRGAAAARPRRWISRS